MERLQSKLILLLGHAFFALITAI